MPSGASPPARHGRRSGIRSADRYRDELGIGIDPAGSTRIGGQVISLVPADDSAGGTPVIDLVGERGSPTLDLVLFGIRWRRREA